MLDNDGSYKLRTSVSHVSQKRLKDIIKYSEELKVVLHHLVNAEKWSKKLSKTAKYLEQKLVEIQGLKNYRELEKDERSMIILSVRLQRVLKSLIRKVKKHYLIVDRVASISPDILKNIELSAKEKSKFAERHRKNQIGPEIKMLLNNLNLVTNYVEMLLRLEKRVKSLEAL